VCLAVFPANAGAGATSNTCSWVRYRHHLAQNLFIVIQTNDFAILRQPLKRHHVTPAHLEASPAANAGFRIDG
jgi:hypothetical protein